MIKKNKIKVQISILVSIIMIFSFISTSLQSKTLSKKEKIKFCIEYYNITKKLIPECEDVIEIENGKPIAKKNTPIPLEKVKLLPLKAEKTKENLFQFLYQYL